MKFRRFGRTGLQVSPVCLGTMTFGKEADEATSVGIMNRALEVGVNFFDTANLYSKGISEEIIGRWMGPHREDIVLASKVYFPMSDRPNDRGSSRRNIMLSTEKSLRRLRTDWLDILYLHRWDDHTALEESLAAVTTLVEQGKVLYCGVSNFSAWQTMKACGLAAARRFAPVVCIQPMYNLVKRQAEVEILPMAQSEGLAVCPYSPMAAGLLSGKYQRGQMGRIKENEMYARRYRESSYMEVSNRFVRYAEDHGCAPSALAVAWVMSHPAVTCPIIGARNVEQLNETLGCLDMELSANARAEITALSIDPPCATDRSEETISEEDKQ